MKKGTLLFFTFIFALLLSGCSSLTDKYYSSSVRYTTYNVNEDIMYPYVHTPTLVIRYGSQFTFWENRGNIYRSVGGMKWVTKENYKERMSVFVEFIKWANLPKESRDGRMPELNNSQIFKDREIEFGYYKDGTPAFIDTYQNTMAFERLYLPTKYEYFDVKSITQLLIESEIALSNLK
ncbi:hypothetical protein ABN057_15550 [Providencia alcalifaciens]|uniref:hypothetical protein n=1 Tax=Providencia alcalifaciens TaxID=126385 RepID=UPI0032DA05A1